jgi:hypothetical protein
LTALSVDDDIAHDPGVTVPQFFANALKFYEEMTCTSAPIVVGPSLEIYVPPVVDGACVLCYVLDTLVSLLDIEDIVRLVAAVLLDGQIVVIGSSLKEITHTVLAIRLLAGPLGFCGPVVPILPSDPMFISLLGSPCPFIIEVVPNDEVSELQFLDTTMFVYLDSRLVSRSSDPPYPRHRCVIDRVERILAKERAPVPHPFGFPAVLRRYSNHKYGFSQTTASLITAAFREPFAQLIGDEMEWFFVTDNTTSMDQGGVIVFNTELFVAQSSPDSQPFLREFMHSQNFEVYIDSRINRFLARKGTVGRAAKVSRIEAGRTSTVRRSRSLGLVYSALNKHKSFAATGK